MYFSIHFIWYICLKYAFSVTFFRYLYLMNLGERIKISRQKKKMSQQDLGNNAETHQKNISKYEQNTVVPSAITLKKIADALEVTTDYLLGGDNDNVIKDTQLLAYFKAIDTMPDDIKSSLLKVIDAYVRDYKTQQAYK